MDRKIGLSKKRAAWSAEQRDVEEPEEQQKARRGGLDSHMDRGSVALSSPTSTGTPATPEPAPAADNAEAPEASTSEADSGGESKEADQGSTDTDGEPKTE